MNPGSVRRFVLALTALALAIVAGGFLWGLLLTGDAPRARAASDDATGSAIASRDLTLALRTLDAHAHWGRYTPPAEGVARAAPKPRNLTADAISESWRLVGIQRREGEPLALLLPAGAPDDSADLVRLRKGEKLAEGISVSAIEADSVRFSTESGNSTLYLYGSAP